MFSWWVGVRFWNESRDVGRRFTLPRLLCCLSVVAVYRGLIKRIWFILFLLFFLPPFPALSAEFSQPGASLFWRPLFVISPLPSFSSRVESLTKFPPFLRRKGAQRAFRVRAPFLPASASFLILDKTTRGSYY